MNEKFKVWIYKLSNYLFIHFISFIWFISLKIYLFNFLIIMDLKIMVERASQWVSLGLRAHGWDLSKGKDEIGARWSKCSRAIRICLSSVEALLSGRKKDVTRWSVALETSIWIKWNDCDGNSIGACSRDDSHLD